MNDTYATRRPWRRSRGFALVKPLVGVGVLASLGVGGWALVGFDGAEESLAPDVFEVARMDFQVRLTGNGELRARNQTSLRSELEKASAIVEIVKEGTIAREGDVLVELNSDEIRKRLDDEMLQLESARSDLISAENSYEIQLSDNESALRKAQLKLELAELELRKWQEGEVKEKRMELQLDIERAEREHERLEEKVERSRQLYANGFLSKDELQKDELEFVEAQSKLKTTGLASQVYEEFTYDKQFKEKSSAVDESRAEIQRVNRKNESELAQKEANRTNRRRQLQLREERVAKLDEQLENCVIHAPTDGLVVYSTSVGSRHWRSDEEPLDVGTTIQPNEEIIILPDTREMMAVVKIPEAMLGRVHAGQRAVVSIDAAGGKTFEGAVETIGVMAQSGGWRDPNVREYEVRIALEVGRDEHGLKPSMRCEARIVLSDVDEAIAVPVQSVFAEGHHRFVYSVEGDRYVQTVVSLGRRSDTYAEILSGLSQGQRVLLREPSPTRIVKADFEQEAPTDPSKAIQHAAARGRPADGAAGRPGRPGGRRPGPDAHRQQEPVTSPQGGSDSPAESTTNEPEETSKPASTEPARSQDSAGAGG